MRAANSFCEQERSMNILRKSFLSVLFFIVACAYADDTIRIVSINVWSGLTYRGTFSVGTHETAEEHSFRYGLLVHGLQKLDADVIILNEANPLPRYAKKLARDLEMDQIYSIRAGGVRLGPVGFPVNLREGDVVLARSHLSLEYLGSRDIIGGPAGNVGSFHRKPPTQVVSARVTVGETKLFIFTTRWTDSEAATEKRLQELARLFSDGTLTADEYLSRVQNAVAGRERRIDEAEKTIRFVDEIAGDSPTVFAGTLHAGPGSREVQKLIDAGFEDSWSGGNPGYTRDASQNTTRSRFFETGDERERVDYVMIRGEGVSIVDSAIALNEPTFDVHPSDHFGLVTEIRIRSRNSDRETGDE